MAAPWATGKRSFRPESQPQAEHKPNTRPGRPLGFVGNDKAMGGSALEWWGEKKRGGRPGRRGVFPSEGSQDGGGALSHGGAIHGDGGAAGKALGFAAGDVQATTRVGEFVVERRGQVAVSE